jgi:acetylornithine deacetylase/succinyl-diaminopimelate desuccinylase-like protein
MFPAMEDSVRDEYFELLRFPTVGADPTHLRDCVQCAMWLKAWLGKLGFTGELITEGGNPPFLLAERPGAEGAPVVMLYGHYDVQPPDPLDEWETPPFEPVVRDGRVYARGAQDDKGQFFAFLCGIRDYLSSAGDAAPTLKILLDGQEESGSPVLDKLAPSLRARLRADVLAVCDTSAAKGLRPAIVAGLRGVSHFTVRLEGANRDLHSGEYGGTAPNAAQAMCELLASLHDANGAIAVRGFDAGFEPPTEDERAAAESAAVSPEEFERDVGVPPVGGEKGLTLTERNSFRPTIEVNGVHSGYGGPGSKTVIPCHALAKISMRLVPGMNPQNALAAIERHMKAHLPPGMKLFIEEVTGEAAGFRLPLASPLFRLASHVLAELDPRGAVYQWVGASIPVVSTLKHLSGAAPLLVGFGQCEDRIHSPNESFGFAQFALCRAWAAKLLAAI